MYTQMLKDTLLMQAKDWKKKYPPITGRLYLLFSYELGPIALLSCVAIIMFSVIASVLCLSKGLSLMQFLDGFHGDSRLVMYFSAVGFWCWQMAKINTMYATMVKMVDMSFAYKQSNLILQNLNMYGAGAAQKVMDQVKIDKAYRDVQCLDAAFMDEYAKILRDSASKIFNVPSTAVSAAMLSAMERTLSLRKHEERTLRDKIKEAEESRNDQRSGGQAPQSYSSRTDDALWVRGAPEVEQGPAEEAEPVQEAPGVMSADGGFGGPIQAETLKS